MLINTRHFGEIDIEESAIIDFQEGIPGFEDTRRFALLGHEQEDSPFKWLQCIERPELAFAIVDPFMVKKDYDIEINQEIVSSLGINKPEEVLVYSIVVVPEDMSKISMNLKAPIIVNKENKKGMQVILDTDKYTVRHYVMEELRRQEVNCNACVDKEEGSVHSNK